MAKDLEGKEVQASRTTKFVTVANQNPHPAADPFYVAIRGELDSTIKDLLREEIVPQFSSNIKQLEKMFPEDGEITLLFTREDIAQALIRASKNAEDIPEASLALDWFEELFD